MIFTYPATPHPRRHGPRGYTSYHSFKPWLRDEFAFRCVFFLVRERWEPQGAAAFAVEHLIRRAEAPHMLCAYDILLYACMLCETRRGCLRAFRALDFQMDSKCPTRS